MLVDGEYSASLDGMTLDGDLVLEIKCPVKGRQSELWQEVQSGEAARSTTSWQVQHQLMVSAAQLAHVYVFDGSQGRTAGAAAEPRTAGQRSMKGWDGFMEFIERTPRRS